MQQNIYEAYQPLVKEWGNYISVVKEHIEGYSDIEATQLAILLENTKSEIEMAQGRMQHTGAISEATDISMVKTFSSNVFDLITAVMPNLLANDIVTVQPLDRRNGQIFYLKFTYGNTKGGITAGSTMLSSQTGFNGGNYSGEHISGEVLTIDTGAVTHTLSYLPVIPGSVVLTDPTNVTAKVVDVPLGDGTGTFTDTTYGLGSGTINYSTGAISLTGVTATAAEVAWDYNLNSFDATVAEVDVRVEVEPIVARPRKLKSVYMFDVSFDLKANFGLDMDTLILKATSGEIGYEIDHEIMSDLIQCAGSASSWNMLPTYRTMEQKAHNLTLIDAINNGSNTILGMTKRYEGNFIITGKNGATIIEGLGKDHFKRISTGGVVGGPHLVGILEDKYKVYKDPYYGDNELLIGAKGDMFIESGYVYAPYLPLFASQLLVDADFKASRGFCTLYGKKVTNANMYHKLTLVENVQVSEAAESEEAGAAEAGD